MGDFACHGLFSVRLADFHPGAGNWAWRGGLCHDQRHQLLFYRFRLRFPKISFIVSYWLGMADCPCGKASAQSGRGSLRMSAYPGGRDHVDLHKSLCRFARKAGDEPMHRIRLGSNLFDPYSARLGSVRQHVVARKASLARWRTAGCLHRRSAWNGHLQVICPPAQCLQGLGLLSFKCL